MSILREVIRSVEEVEWSILKERLPIIKTNVHLCRLEIFNMLDDVYIEFLQKPVKIAHYSSNLLEFQKELEALSFNCEQGLKREDQNSQKFNDYKTLLKQVRNTIEIAAEVKNCYHIHEKFVDLHLYKSDCEKSLQILKDIKDIMDNTNSATVLKYYRKYKLTESALHLHFGEVLKRKFIFEVEDQKTMIYFKVKKNIDIGNSIHLLLQYKVHIKQLEELMNFLWEFIFVPIVVCRLTITISDTDIKLKIKTGEPQFEEVLKRLHDVLDFLKNNCNIYFDSLKTMSLLDYIGNEFVDRISLLLISRCFKNLNKAVSDGKILDYKSIKKQVENLQIDLSSCKLVTDESLLEYATNLQELHFGKTKDKLFEHMRLIMSKKNYNIVKVGSLFPTSLDLPSMSISSDAQELHQLTEKILLEAKNNRTLIDTVLNIFKLYRRYTTKDVEKMSSVEVALLYNNYTFIGYELREWNSFYSDLASEGNTVPLFKEELLIFHIESEEILENFLIKEVNMLKSHLHKILIDKDISSESIQTVTNKCLKQIEFLKESWLDLLSQMVFNRCIGICFNVLCDSLIKFILEFNVMEINVIENISKIFNSILKRIEEYFVKVSDLKKFIKCWDQFQALSYILKSDIVQIEINKYHELLKSNFKPFEVTKIIKAIFHQNEQRDAILSQLYK